MASISQVWKTVSEDFDFADVDEIGLTVARPWYNSPKLNNSKSKLRNDTEKFLEASETDSMQSGIKEEIIDNNDQRDLPFKCALSETETDWDEVNRDDLMVYVHTTGVVVAEIGKAIVKLGIKISSVMIR